MCPSTFAGLRERRALPFGLDLYKVLNTAIIPAFNILGEIAGRQFSGAPMVMEAFTAGSFPRTGFITAVAFFHILLFIGAIHIDFLHIFFGGMKRAKALERLCPFIRISQYPGVSPLSPNSLWGRVRVREVYPEMKWEAYYFVFFAFFVVVPRNSSRT